MDRERRLKLEQTAQKLRETNLVRQEKDGHTSESSEPPHITEQKQMAEVLQQVVELQLGLVRLRSTLTLFLTAPNYLSLDMVRDSHLIVEELLRGIDSIYGYLWGKLISGVDEL